MVNLRQEIQGRLIVVIFGAALLAGLIFVPVGTVFADADGDASCVGIEFSEISPPGSSSEFSGGAPELTEAVAGIADSLGVPPGAVYSFVAKLHEGSHEACDEATE